MSQTEPGNLAAFTNFKKQAGDKLPSFTGKITLPVSDAERGISLSMVNLGGGFPTRYLQEVPGAISYDELEQLVKAELAKRS